MGAQQTTSIA